MVGIVKVNYSGVGEVLRSNTVALVIHALAEEVASAVREQVPSYAPVDVTDYVTDRAASAVTIIHPAGLPLQAKYGVLTNGAGAAGLEVKEYG